MLETLTIERFKSIRSLSIPCRKVNLFIGAPDTGKTNILEALNFVSRLGWGLPLDASTLRLRNELGFDPLFYRQFFDEPFTITMRGVPLPGGEVAISASLSGADRRLDLNVPPFWSARIGLSEEAQVSQLDWIRFYAYLSSEVWHYNTSFPHGDKIVAPPQGANLTYIARHNSRVYSFLKEIISSLNWKLRFDQAHRTFRLSEVRQDEIFDYNLDLLSDSLKRLFFYGAILLTSEDATLVMDEPDVFAFPPYPKMLGEMIAGDATNQFFLTTHNPYFLAGLIEKTPTDKLAVFVCYRDSDGATAAKLLTQQDVERVIELGPDVFFNLAQFLTA